MQQSVPFSKSMPRNGLSNMALAALSAATAPGNVARQPRTAPGERGAVAPASAPGSKPTGSKLAGRRVRHGSTGELPIVRSGAPAAATSRAAPSARPPRRGALPSTQRYRADEDEPGMIMETKASKKPMAAAASSSASSTAAKVRGPQSTFARFSSPKEAQEYRERRADRDRYEEEEMKAKKSLSESFIRGTCAAMCSRYEYLTRVLHDDVHFLEMTDGKPDYAKFVKKYQRSSAASQQHPEDIRPVQVLTKTLDYLWALLGTHPLDSVYFFIQDRLRAVRRDMVTQNLQDEGSARVYEQCVRFHLICIFLRPKGLDRFQEIQQMNAALSELLHVYGTGTKTCNEIEFRCYEVLLYPPEVEKRRKIVQEFGPIANSFIRATKRIAPLVAQAEFSAPGAAVGMGTFSTQHFSLFIRLLCHPGVPIGVALVASLHLDRLRRDALRNLVVSGYVNRGIVATSAPVSTMIQLLAFADADECQTFLEHFGVCLDSESGDRFNLGGIAAWEHRPVDFKGPQVVQMHPHFLDTRAPSKVGEELVQFITGRSDFTDFNKMAPRGPETSGFIVDQAQLDLNSGQLVESRAPPSAYSIAAFAKDSSGLQPKLATFKFNLKAAPFMPQAPASSTTQPIMFGVANDKQASPAHVAALVPPFSFSVPVANGSLGPAETTTVPVAATVTQSSSHSAAQAMSGFGNIFMVRTQSPTDQNEQEHPQNQVTGPSLFKPIEPAPVAADSPFSFQLPAPPQATTPAELPAAPSPGVEDHPQTFESSSKPHLVAGSPGVCINETAQHFPTRPAYTTVLPNTTASVPKLPSEIKPAATPLHTISVQTDPIEIIQYDELLSSEGSDQEHPISPPRPSSPPRMVLLSDLEGGGARKRVIGTPTTTLRAVSPSSKKARRSLVGTQFFIPRLSDEATKKLDFRASTFSDTRVKRIAVATWRARARLTTIRRSPPFPGALSVIFRSSTALTQLREARRMRIDRTHGNLPRDLMEQQLRELWPELQKQVARLQTISREAYSPWTIIAAVNHVLKCFTDMVRLVADNVWRPLVVALDAQQIVVPLTAKLKPIIIPEIACVQFDAPVPREQHSRVICIGYLKSAALRVIDAAAHVIGASSAETLRRQVLTLPGYNLSVPFSNALLPILTSLYSAMLSQNRVCAEWDKICCDYGAAVATKFLTTRLAAMDAQSVEYLSYLYWSMDQVRDHLRNNWDTSTSASET